MTDCTTKSDGELLCDFAATGSEVAFGELVQRHGNMVRSACLRVLSDHHEAEDVTQAVFLTLARKARGLSGDSSVGGWLHRVARCLAMDVRKARQRRTRYEEAAMRDAGTEDVTVEDTVAFRSELDAAVAALPERFRQPVVLFHLEERSAEETANALGLNPVTLRTRLVRARELLRKKLVRRGVAVGSVGALTTLLSAEAGAAVLPASFVSATVKAAGLAAAGKLAAGVGTGVVSANVAALTKGACNMLFWSSVKTAAVVTAAVATTAVAISIGAQVLADTPSPATAASSARAKEPLPRKPGTVPLAALMDVDFDGTDEESPVRLKDGHFRLGPQLKVLAGLDADRTTDAEAELTALFANYRDILEKHPPKIEKPSATKAVLAFTQLGTAATALESQARTLFAKAVREGRLTATQAAFLRSRTRHGLDEVIPLLHFSSAFHRADGASMAPVSMLVTLEKQSKNPGWDCQTLLSATHQDASCGRSLHGEAASMFLASAGVSAGPARAAPERASVSDLAAIRGSDPDTVPLALLASLTERGMGPTPVFAHGFRGRLALTPMARDICGLDASQSKAVEDAYSAVYGVFLSVVSTHPPRVETNGPTSVSMVFDDLQEELRPLRAMADNALATVVDAKILTTDQSDVLRPNCRRTLEDLTFDYGESLHTITIECKRTKASALKFWDDRPAWSVQMRYDRGGRRKGGGGSSGDTLPEAYRPFLWFVPFAQKDALPPVDASPVP
jgi:RNA polymerase sigma factor (sigma-70 family)